MKSQLICLLGCQQSLDTRFTSATQSVVRKFRIHAHTRMVRLSTNEICVIRPCSYTLRQLSLPVLSELI